MIVVLTSFYGYLNINLFLRRAKYSTNLTSDKSTQFVLLSNPHTYTSKWNARALDSYSDERTRVFFNLRKFSFPNVNVIKVSTHTYMPLEI